MEEELIEKAKQAVEDFYFNDNNNTNLYIKAKLYLNLAEEEIIKCLNLKRIN